jgi:hypothetical protein
MEVTMHTLSDATKAAQYEQAARALGWTRDGDNGGVIYNVNDYDSWKAAVSWSPRDGSIYDTWEECCEMESIEV